VRVGRLTSQHDLSRFDCGVTALNGWLRAHALENQLRDLSRTFVLVDDGANVVGYYSLTMGGVRKEALPAHYGRGLPRYEIGMVLLARFAIARSRQGEGLGRDLLIEAIERAAAAGQHAAARFIAVDPTDAPARAFYEAFGFEQVGGDERGRMFLRIDEAIAALQGGDPRERDI
jgi:GNAT superfamily N-acetyltransferase